MTFLLGNSITTTRFYRTWNNMKRRCFDKNNPNYHNYGGRGITICERWLKYENFEEDMYEEYGYRLEKFGDNRRMNTLERVDNNKGYSKENCRWATMKEQSNNRRITEKSKGAREMKVICANLGIKYPTFKYRKRIGFSTEEALSMPLSMGKKLQTAS